MQTHIFTLCVCAFQMQSVFAVERLGIIMGNIILAGLIAFLAAMTFVGYKRGLIKTVFSLLSIIIILVVVTILTPTVQIVIKETPLYPFIKENVQEYINNNVGKDMEEKAIIGLGASEQKKVIDSLPMPQNMREELINGNTENGYNLLEVTNFKDYLVESVTDMIINSIAFIILFVVVTIAIKVAVYLLDIITKLPVLNFFNKGGGAVVGFIEAMMIIWTVCIIITAFSATEWAQKLFVEVNNNVILGLIYNNNILEIIIKGFF